MELILPSGLDRAASDAVVAACMEQVGVPDGWVRSMLVTNTLEKEVAKLRGYKSALTEGAESAAQAIPSLDDGEVVTDVAMQARLFQLVLPSSKGQIYGRRDEVLYMVKHELGHAKDYRLRTIQGLLQQDRQSPFNLKYHDSYLLHALLNEFAACVHSGVHVGQAVFDAQCNTLGDYVEHTRLGIESNTHAYLQGDFRDDAPGTFAVNILTGYWEVLTSYAKLFGLMMADDSLRFSRLIWRKPCREIGGDFEGLRSALGDWWSKYPDGDGKVETRIIEHCDDLMSHDRGFWFSGDTLNLSFG